VIHFLIIERYVSDYRFARCSSRILHNALRGNPEGANASDLDFVLLSATSADPNPAQVPASMSWCAGPSCLRNRRPLMMSLAEMIRTSPFPAYTDEEETSRLANQTPVKPAKSTRPVRHANSL